MQNQDPPTTQTPSPQASYDPHAPQNPAAQQHYQQSPYAPAQGQAYPGYVVVDKDLDHINLLAVFHYVYAGLSSLGLLFLYGHYKMMSTMMNMTSGMSSSSSSPMTPAEKADVENMMGAMMDGMMWFYLIVGIIIILTVVVNILSAVWMKQRRNRMFSFVVAGFNCLALPFGTVLGVFTLIVLNRPSVAQKYSQSKLSR